MSSLTILGDTSGSVLLQAPAVSGATTLTLPATTGTLTLTSQLPATSQLVKAWVNFNGGNGNTAGVINGSFNVSSITVSNQGIFLVNFTTAMANANYVVVTSGRAASTGSTDNTFASLLRTPQTTSQTGVFYATTGGAASACYQMNVIVIGS
jgi:hypothetical protein